MSRPLIHYIDNDMVVVLDELQNSDGLYQNAATVTATLQKEDGTEVTGQTWPVSLVYVTDSDGRYEGILQDTCILTDGVSYVLVITAISEGNQSHWELPVEAQIRRKTA